MRATTGAIILFMSLLWLITQPLNAQLAERGERSSWVPSAQLEAQIRSEIGRRWGIEPARIHLEWGETRRHDLSGEGLEFRLIGNGAGGNWIVAFQTTDNGHSSFRVWLRAGVKVEVPIAAHDIERGEILSESDITTTSIIRWDRVRRVEEVDLVGWIAQRRIGAGENLREPLVVPPPAVRSGEWVEVHWKRPGILLTLRAKAERSARVGERIRVRTETGQRLEGIARETGIVEIETPPEVM